MLNASIKSGTNQLHGAAWEFLRNDVLDAADFFQNANSQPKGAFKQNQFGAAGGGPILEEHVVFLRRLRRHAHPAGSAGNGQHGANSTGAQQRIHRISQI